MVGGLQYHPVPLFFKFLPCTCCLKQCCYILASCALSVICRRNTTLSLQLVPGIFFFLPRLAEASTCLLFYGEVERNLYSSKSFWGPSSFCLIVHHSAGNLELSAKNILKSDFVWELIIQPLYCCCCCVASGLPSQQSLGEWSNKCQLSYLSPISDIWALTSKADEVLTAHTPLSRSQEGILGKEQHKQVSCWFLDTFILYVLTLCSLPP